MPNRLTLTEAAEQIRTTDLSPVTLVESCLARIDETEDRIHAWVTLDIEGAFKEASVLAKEAESGCIRGSLHGIPVGIKDIIFTKGLLTRGGSVFFENHVPDYDATLVQRLKNAGAIILGKTVTTEFAGFDPAETRNPWNPRHTPGGSSSGTAASVASRMIPAAVGTQTGGSISRPAAYCGVVGFKPTYGRVSLRGVFELAFSLDHIGPLARTVADAAMVGQVIAGYDPKDLYSVNKHVDFILEPPSPAPRIGLVHALFADATEEETRDITLDAVARLERAGASTPGVRLPKSFKEVHKMHRIIMRSEGSAYHADRFGRKPKQFRPKLRGMIEEGLLLPAAAYVEAKKHQSIFSRDIQCAFKDVDIIVTPAAPAPAPYGLQSTGDPLFNSPWSYSGLPTVVLPVGLSSNGLPIAIQLIGRAWDEATLLGIAKWCESVIDFSDEPAL
ncbi:MAG: amidase [Candidatus Latescibacterota bacterium]|nr:amidase [Candidatus Latescibacterota bacterium]